jgi:DNA polymerase I-like protein with 3'-5' exonuclease and polymerase domains
MATVGELLVRIQDSGGEVGLRGGEVFLRCRNGVLSADEVQQLRAAEDEVKELLRLVDGPSEANRLDWFRTCENLLKRLEGVSSPYPFQWNGDQLRGTEVALDCETTLVQGEEVPDLVLVAVSDGQRSFVLQPQQLGPFLELHRSRNFVCHNTAFDFRVVKKSLSDPAVWWEVADEGRLHDTMLLDMLISLAESDAYPRPRNLGQVAKQWAGMDLDKSDPFRTRFSELIGADWGQVDPGFFEYAVRDAEATVRSWRTMKTAAKKFRTTDRFGLLTEHLQTLAAVALAEITSNGMELDLDLVKRNRGAFAKRLLDLTAQLRNLPEAAGLLQTCRQRTLFAAEAEVGRPSFNQKRLRAILRRIAEDRDLSPPTTGKTGELTTSVKWWAAYAEDDPFLKLWVQLEQTAKLFQFFEGLKSRRIHPKYSTLVRTGRTSCSGPNIQQLPREGGFREMVVASPGHVLLTVDFSAIELRTLAAVCEKTLGFSRLAEVFRKRIDPHSFTAAEFADMSLEDFLQLPKQKRKPLRQKAKALNFGIPGGLGAKSLVVYSKQSYGVDLSLEEAERFRQKLVTEVYPEMDLYLREDPGLILASNLRTDPQLVTRMLPAAALGAARRIVLGKLTKPTGEDYLPTFVSKVWEVLRGLNRNPDLRSSLENRRSGELLFRQLFWTSVETTTGRRRASVNFSQARNTPFQGLAADGAKLSLWRLYREGFRTVAFVHDEVVVELPESADYSAAADKVVRLLVSSMSEVMESDIPVEVEFSLSRRWWKEAEEVRSEDGQLMLWEPGQAVR